MKKIISFITLLITFISSCTALFSCNKEPSHYEQAKQYRNSIINCIKSRDKSGLTDIFSPYTKNKYSDVEKEIDLLFEFIDGNIVSYDELLPSCYCTDYGENGTKFVKEDFEGKISNVVTDTNKKYEIIYKGWVAYDEPADFIGLHLITVRDMYSNEHLKVSVGTWEGTRPKL